MAAATEALASPADPLTAASATAVADILTMTARTMPTAQPPLAEATELLYRGIGGRRSRRAPAPDARAMHLRSLARLIGLMGQLSDDRDVAAALRLVYLVAGFADNLATLRQAQQRRAQAAAASTAAAHLHTVTRNRPPVCYHAAADAIRNGGATSPSAQLADVPGSAAGYPHRAASRHGTRPPRSLERGHPARDGTPDGPGRPHRGRIAPGR